MVIGQHCHNQHNGILAQPSSLNLCSKHPCQKNRTCFSLSNLHKPVVAARSFSSAVSSSESPVIQTEVLIPFEPTRTAKSPSRRSFLESTVDKNGYLCSPRAARELAFSILYSALVLDEKPMRVFRSRLKQQSGYLSKEILARYKHAPDDNDSLIVEDSASAEKLKREQLEESLLEAAVLSAPPSKVYSRSILLFAQDIIKVTEDSWSEHDIILQDLLPDAWKEKSSHAAPQKCILHMSMAEMTRCGTSLKIVISEAVDLAKRFVDRGSAELINSCLGKFVRSEHYKQGQRQRWR